MRDAVNTFIPRSRHWLRRMHARQRHARTGGAAVQPFPKMTAETKKDVVSAIEAINTSHQHRYG